MKTKAIFTGLSLLPGVFLSSCTQDAKESEKPNIILILADDMGYECVGANGSTYYQTPRLDLLASTGLRFENCYSQPICTPSRVQIMTGRYNHRNYTRFAHLYKGEITFANIMKDAGYATCVAGKWQLDGGMEAPYHFGFDEYCLWQVTRRPSRFPNPGLEINGKEVDFTNGEYGPDIVTDYILDFMKRQRDQPFFVYYPMILPHFPFEPTPDSPDWDPKSPGILQGIGDTVYFKDMVAYVDKMVGKIVDGLEELSLRENTIVIFTADNGTYMGINSPTTDGVVTGGKGLLSNAGTHVPLIISWPSKIQKRKVVADLIDFSDFFPTFAELTGSQMPDDRPIDGISFAPLLRGERQVKREWIYCWYNRGGQRFADITQESARDKTYRLYHDGRFYNVVNDVLEKKVLDVKEMGEEAKNASLVLQSVLTEMATHKLEVPLEELGK